MPLTLNAWHATNRPAWHPHTVSISGESPIKTINGYYTAAELRVIARQLIIIANDSDQGETGPATYTVED